MTKDIKVHELSLDDDLFEGFVIDFNSSLAGIIKTMNEKNVDQAAITTKTIITLEKVAVSNPTADNMSAMREAVRPNIKHSVVSTITTKDEKKGQLPEGYEIIIDPDTQEFVLVKIDDGQSSMFDSSYTAPQDYGQTSDDDADVQDYDPDDDQEALPQRFALLGSGDDMEV